MRSFSSSSTSSLRLAAHAGPASRRLGPTCFATLINALPQPDAREHHRAHRLCPLDGKSPQAVEELFELERNGLLGDEVQSSKQRDNYPKSSSSSLSRSAILSCPSDTTVRFVLRRSVDTLFRSKSIACKAPGTIVFGSTTRPSEALATLATRQMGSLPRCYPLAFFASSTTAASTARRLMRLLLGICHLFGILTLG